MMTLFLGLREHAPTTVGAHSHTRSAAAAGTSRSLGPLSTLGFVTYCSKASGSKSEPQTLRPSCPLTIPYPSSPHLSSISPCLIPQRPPLPSSLLLSLTLSGLPIPPPQIWPAHPSCLLPQSVLPPTLICPSSPPVSVTTLLPPSSAWLCVPLLCPLAPSSSPL